VIATTGSVTISANDLTEDTDAAIVTQLDVIYAIDNTTSTGTIVEKESDTIPIIVT
jgi:hypothetical protein